MNYSDFADNINEGLNNVKGRVDPKWVGSRHHELKISSRTALGDFGEERLCKALCDRGVKASIVNKGKGDFDILLENGIRLEVKTATEDTSGNYQFNGIKIDNTNYDYVLCLGVAPNDLFINMWSKEHCVENLSVPMTRGGSDGYKLSAGVRRGSRVRNWEVHPLTNDNFNTFVKEKLV
jgi:hypothetical protein|tara:strand:- start:2684 stop:3220 length:537 start_codon:yes stop_codon:yes gene_type:complete